MAAALVRAHGLGLVMEYAVETTFLIRDSALDWPGPAGSGLAGVSVIRLVEGEKDALNFFCAKHVRNEEVTLHAAIANFTITQT